MPRVSFLFRTDTHVCDRSPASWRGDYPAEIWSNLEQIGRFTKEYNVTGVLDGGDYFHVKAASKNPHALVTRTANIHKGYSCPVWCIEGNHDIAYNNLETLERQPLGVLYASGIFGHLREEVFRDGNTQVRVVGVPYSPIRKLEELRSIRKKPGDTHLVCIVHALAGKAPPPQVEEFFGEPVFTYQDLITPDGPDVWCFGHWHRDQGIETIDGKMFVNHGAVSRGALIRENLERHPKVALIDIDGNELKVSALKLDVLPAKEVFDIEKKQAQDAERRDIEQFILKLTNEALFDPEVSIQDNIRSLSSFAQNVQDKALHYFELAEAG